MSSKRSGSIFRWRSPDGSEVLAIQQLARLRQLRRPCPIPTTASDGSAGSSSGSGPRCTVRVSMPSCSATAPTICRWCLSCRRSAASWSTAFPARSSRSRAMPITSGRSAPPNVPCAYRRAPRQPAPQHPARRQLRAALRQARQRAGRAAAARGRDARRAALRCVSDEEFPGQDFGLAWRELLRCHPHDTICGCSCDEVHRDAIARYESLRRTLSVLEARSLAFLADDRASGRRRRGDQPAAPSAPRASSRCRAPSRSRSSSTASVRGR